VAAAAFRLVPLPAPPHGQIRPQSIPEPSRAGDLIADQSILLGSTATGDINALLAVRCVSSGNCWASASWKA
jgi:hypothetical protein